MTFDDLQFHDRYEGHLPRQAVVFFANNYGASVIQEMDWIKGEGSHWTGEFELAVLHRHARHNPAYVLDYSTPITDDTDRGLTEADVTELLARIEALPARDTAP